MNNRFMKLFLLPILALLVSPLLSFNPTARRPRREHVRVGTTVQHVVHNNANDDEETRNQAKNEIYRLLATSRDCKPGRGNFLYNDEIISHLHGYMYLVGFFAAQDEIFLSFFFVYASLAAGGTQASNSQLLPANPRVPGLVAGLTLLTTWIVRYGVGYEFMFWSDEINYTGPSDTSLYWETAICALNVGWGFFGSWRTKDPINGATYGF